MKQAILEIKGLTKAYGKTQVLRGIDFRLEKGSFCGLIGPNGAGKTTLLRILTGLTHQTEGTVCLFGEEGVHPSTLRRMGCLVEKPRIHPGMTAKENLAMQQTLLGIPEDKTDLILEQVGLRDVGGKKVGKLSVGMKQRLGIGFALIGNPDILCLDEPTNGLDPQGMLEIRELLRSLNGEKGVTILMSSHMLGEMEKVASCYGILRDGAMRTLTKEQIAQKSRRFARIVTGNPQAAAVVMDAFVLPQNGYEVRPDGSFWLYEGLEGLHELNARLVESGVAVHELSRHNLSLEDIFMEEGEENHNA